MLASDFPPLTLVSLPAIDSDMGDENSTSDSGGRGMNGSTLKTNKKPRKARTAFTDQQLNCLEKSFERQKYLSVQDRMELAARLNLSDTQVKTWYQNRRFVRSLALARDRPSTTIAISSERNGNVKQP